jgi:hypothetical protein
LSQWLVPFIYLPDVLDWLPFFFFLCFLFHFVLSFLFCDFISPSFAFFWCRCMMRSFSWVPFLCLIILSQESFQALRQRARSQPEQYGNCTIRTLHRTNSFMILVVACFLLCPNDTYAFPFILQSIIASTNFICVQKYPSKLSPFYTAKVHEKWVGILYEQWKGR